MRGQMSAIPVDTHCYGTQYQNVLICQHTLVHASVCIDLKLINTTRYLLIK